MNDKILKGIALILFGILLCVGSEEINSTILSNFSDFPFSLLGSIIGTVGIMMAILKNKKD